MEDLLAIKDLNSFHLIVGIVGILLVIFITIFACCKKLENEKFWIAMVAFIAFSTYCVIDYDLEKAKFRHPAPSVPCYCYPEEKIPGQSQGNGDK